MPQHTDLEKAKNRKKSVKKPVGILPISCDSGKCLNTKTPKKSTVITTKEINSLQKKILPKPTTRIKL